jgi:hypothetical protein
MSSSQAKNRDEILVGAYGAEAVCGSMADGERIPRQRAEERLEKLKALPPTPQRAQCESSLRKSLAK